ncbi:MAG: hypothetical protein WCE44_11735 [Candidatus Velthaea sp.]
MPRRFALLALTCSLALTVPFAAPAAAAPTPAPSPQRTPYRIDVTTLQPKAILPKSRLHTDFIVEINKEGQVSRVLSGHKSGNLGFDEHTYGNALQAFIRTPDGQVVLGKYELKYDYDPKTQRVRRTVSLVSEGGVNPNAIGAVDDMLKHARRAPAPQPSVAPKPAPSIDNRALPELHSVMHSSPSPTR